MKGLYASPLRVYLCLGALALAGIVSGLNLPISLFPNSARPEFWIGFDYGNATAEEFLESYGRELEAKLQAVEVDGYRVEKIEASYEENDASYELVFEWGASPTEAEKEVRNVVTSLSSRFPEEVRNSARVWLNNENSGFFAASLYSPTRDLEELYDLLEPVLGPEIAKVKDAQEAVLFNPTSREISLELDPEKMAALQILPRQVSGAVQAALDGYSGGSVTVGSQQLTIQMPKSVRTLEDLQLIPVPTGSGRAVHLADVARIDYGPKSTDSRSFKTSGAASLILWATPKAGGNVKRMSEELLAIVERLKPGFPKDVQYKVLVDPSEFVRSSISNVLHEVAIGSLLAVAVLFLFIGSFKNVVTAALEIPLSMILAFILMKLTGMNLNLISLGGLALSSGMNVDASVVVMENIFRHFEKVKGTLSAREKLRIIATAVAEVRFPVIASTLSSLVVFLPLAFTSGLSSAILGDLAKTVVFSHGLSMFVALILVPTVRLQIMSREKGVVHPVSPIEKQLKRLENGYVRGLGAFVRSRKLQLATYASVLLVLVASAAWILPRLPREVIAMPDTDWMFLSVGTSGNTLLRQMESESDEIEARLLEKFGEKIQYTFTQVRGQNRTTIMARLKDKSEMRGVWKAMEAEFTNTPFLRFNVGPWNPAELPIPDPPQMRLVVRGGSTKERSQAAEELKDRLESSQAFDRLWAEPVVGHAESVVLKPGLDRWVLLQNGTGLLPSDLADLSRVATSGKVVDYFPINSRTTDIVMRYPPSRVSTVEDLGALPVGLGGRILPLRALLDVGLDEVSPTIYRESQREVFGIFGKQNESNKGTAAAALENAKRVVKGWKAPVGISAQFEEADTDLTDAIHQLGWAVALSIALIFLTLLLQFGSAMDAVLVLAAVPLGFVGVLLSLFVFGSTLSLNSILGVILLNGIAVANSIILVDFMKRRVEAGLSPEEAAEDAARTRLRPILITSLTTILGMLPIALGFGEGGRILQPLGIAVSGGLWVSMGLTLFIVPALQVAWLRRRKPVLASEKGAIAQQEESLADLPAGAVLLERDPEFVPGYKVELATLPVHQEPPRQDVLQ